MTYRDAYANICGFTVYHKGEEVVRYPVLDKEDTQCLLYTPLDEEKLAQALAADVPITVAMKPGLDGQHVLTVNLTRRWHATRWQGETADGQPAFLVWDHLLGWFLASWTRPWPSPDYPGGAKSCLQ